MESDKPRQFVIAAMRSALGLDNLRPLPCGQGLSEPEAEEVARIVLSNKIAGCIRSGALRAGIELPTKLDSILQACQAQAVAKNLANLIETERVLAILKDRVEAVVIKGPIRSFEVYGRLDGRVSTDIDILVRPKDYERAGTILCEHGYRRGVSKEDRWWHQHLGESPFLSPDGHCTVDVHHKVQQPGGPSPRDLGSFHDHARIVRVANREFRVLGAHEAFLLSYISVSKAMRSEELWLGYAAEIAAIRLRMSDETRLEFHEIASRQGLSRLVSHVDRVVDILIAPLLDRGADPAYDAQLFELAAQPFSNGTSRGRRFHRSRLLWEWADGGKVRRARTFVRYVVELMVSDLRRVSESST